MQLNLTSFPPGSDITIMGTMTKRFKDENDKFKELLTLVYKDNQTGFKHKKEIIDPDFTFYRVKNGEHVDYNRLFIDKNAVEEHIVPHRVLDRKVADELGMTKWYKDALVTGAKDEIRKLHTHPDLFMSDGNLEDHYRFWFAENYTNEPGHISKAYFDIEVDGIDMEGDFPRMGECPVNAITVLFQDQKQIYTLLLKTNKNLQIDEFEKFIVDNGTRELHSFVYSHVTELRGRDKKGASFGVEEFNYNIIFFDEEHQLLKSFFALMNKVSPDFAMAWNQAFDIPYMIERIWVLGMVPSEIMCHPDFKYKFAEYYIDERAMNEPAERCDYARISAYTTYLDQMIQFASRRKGQSQYASLSLDSIGEKVAKVRKLDYKHITTNIAELPYKDYKTFVYYNVIDVITQYCIEQVAEDIDFVFTKALANNTRYSKVHRQTVYLANRAQKDFYRDGFIIGNNVNKFNSKPTTKFPGAFVADPLKVSDYSRMKINGKPINIFENADDWDFASLYPSWIRQANIAAHTQIGMIIIANQMHAKENRRKDPQYVRGGAFLEDFNSHQWLETGHRWYNLQTFEELVDFVRNFFTNIYTPHSKLEFEDSVGKYHFPIIDMSNTHCPILFSPPVDETTLNWTKEWSNNVAIHPNQSF